jgi:hypothetical protein
MGWTLDQGRAAAHNCETLGLFISNPVRVPVPELSLRELEAGRDR